MVPLANNIPEAAGTANAPSTTLTSASQRLLFVACGLSASLLIATAIICATVYVNERRKNSRQPSDAGFCCSDEAHELVLSVNRSVSPCRDFFAYVCSNVISDEVSVESALNARLREAMITGVMPRGVATGEAARFLNAYYQTCVHATRHHESFVSSLARALARDAAHLLTRVDSRNAMMFCVAVQLKYYLASVVHMSYFNPRKLYLRSLPACPLNNLSIADLINTVEALKISINTTVTVEQAVMMAKQLCENISGVAEALVRYHVWTGTSNFSVEVWNIDDFGAALHAHGVLMKDVQSIRVRGPGRILLFYNLFSGSAPSGSKAAYLVWHAAVSGAREFNVQPGTISSRIFEICTSSVFLLQGLWGLFQAEILTSSQKDVEAKNIFATVKSTAREQFKSSGLFDHEDNDTLERFFENVALLTPMSVSRASVPVPTATSDFAQNLLNGRSYNLDLNSARLSVLGAKGMTRYRDLELVEDRFVLLSSTAYNFIRTDSYSARLPNMAVLGQLIAEGLWAIVLRHIHWKSATEANIKELQDCFLETYLPEDVLLRNLDVDQVFYSALGLSTVLGALNAGDWHIVKETWDLWALSEAQFFYIYGSHHRCPREASPEARVQVNTPLIFVEDFARTFSCSSESPMTNVRRCRVRDAPLA